MKRYLISALLLVIISPADAAARPISYGGGWMAMLQNDESRNAAELSYTLNPTIAIGLRSEYNRDNDYQLHSIIMNNRLWRGNYPEAQANLYVLSGLGYAVKDGFDEQSPAAFTGIEADWENRRLFTSYENRYVHAGDVDTEFSQAARVGVAPYIAEAGALHTWFMLQVDHKPEQDDNFTVTPLVRFFKSTHLVEAGVSDNGTILLNYTHQF